MRLGLSVLVLLTVLALACGDDGDSPGDEAIGDELIDRLRAENADHYAFGCTDRDGTVLSGNESPAAIAQAVDIKHTSDSWVSDTSVVVLGADGGQAVIIYDPLSDATRAEEFARREVGFEEGTLVCLVPQ